MITILILACLFVAFANGANDVSRGIATLAGSGLSNSRAAMWGTAWTVVGALSAALMPQALVATFNGKGLLATPASSHETLLAVSCGAIGWLLIATAPMQSGTAGILWPAVAMPGGATLRDSRPSLPKVEVAQESQCGESVARITLIDSLHWLTAGATSFFRGMNDTPKILALGITAGVGVHWKMVGEMALAWIVTLPASAIIAAMVYKLMA